MPLVVDDKSKDEVLDKIMERIIFLQNEYLKMWHWLGPVSRAAIREAIAKHAMNYNTIVMKRANKSAPNRLKPLYQPGPMPEAEKLKLIQLIEST